MTTAWGTRPRQSPAARAAEILDTRRALTVRRALRDAMCDHAVPRTWLGCRLLRAANRQGLPGFHVQVVVTAVAHGLLPHAVALQQALLANATRMDPHAKGWIFSVAWVLETGEGRAAAAGEWKVQGLPGSQPGGVARSA